METLKYITSAKDLITPRSNTRAGFLAQALRKTQEASPYIQKAKELLARSERAKTLNQLVKDPEIQDELAAAAGFSEKAVSHFSSQQLEEAVLRVIQDIRREAGKDWKAELVYRFLLTKGDSLGGAMRNIMGEVAKSQFSDIVISSLKEQGIKSSVEITDKQRGKIRSINWNSRILLFDVKPPIIGKNIDIILLNNAGGNNNTLDLLGKPKNYLVCGELKGGIDPAGADEHWKTARTALDRISEKIEGKRLKLFFAGAAIEASMASEIWRRLKSAKLSYAANLTVPEQVGDLVLWLLRQ